MNNEVSNNISSASSKGGKKRVSFNTASAKDYVTNEAYKTLRTNLMFSGAGVKTIMITSSNENEGKSTVSTELARSLAEAGKKTLFIDADMRKSVILKNNDNVKGLSELLLDMCSADDVIYGTQDENFDVLFTGHFPPNPVEILGGDKFKALLDELKKTYDYIIIDTPPIGIVIDAAVIASCCDGAVLVLAYRKTDRKSAKEAKEQIEKSGCKVLGAVINETEKKNSTYMKKYERTKKYI